VSSRLIVGEYLRRLLRRRRTNLTDGQAMDDREFDVAIGDYGAEIWQHRHKAMRTFPFSDIIPKNNSSSGATGITLTMDRATVV
jgi:hypothetical protein